jgi:Ca2+-binding RTX toxin-like protein
VLVGGTGHDLYYIEAADTVWEEAGGGFDAAIAHGLDFVWVPAQVEKLFLGPGNAGAAGNAGYEEIWGGEGANWIEGGGGDDTLLGNGGIDVLVGGEGRDHFVIRPGDNVTLPDFTPGLDVIWFTGTTLRSPEAVREAQYAAGAGSVVFAAGIEVWLPGLGAGNLSWRDLGFG